MQLQQWLFFLWALCCTDFGGAIVPEDTATLSDSHGSTPTSDPPPHVKQTSPVVLSPKDPPIRQNDKLPNEAFPYLQASGNNIYEERQRFSPRCSERLETALDNMRRRNVIKERTLQLNGYSLHQPMRSVPYDMYVTDMRVRLPQANTWVRVDKCRFDPRNTSLETRLLFNDLTISGRVNLFNELELQREPLDPVPADSCRMILRLRKAGIGFHTEPIRRERGQFNVRTDSHFVEPGFISVYAYGCEPRLRQHRRQLREEEEEDLSREMEDIFLKGIRSLLTTYMQKELQPAIKETLMRNMGYTVSYG